MKPYYIYKLTNKINGLSYIGTSHQIFYRRAKYGRGYKNHSVLFADIDKYGWDSFEKEILEDNLTKDEAAEREKFYIKSFDTTNESKGYNVQSGGFKGYGSQRLKQRVKNAKRTYVMTEEHKKHLSESHKGIIPNEEQNMKNRLSNPNRREIICVETGMVYPSIRYAGKLLGDKNSHKRIQEVLKGKRETACGYHWRYKNNG